MSQEVVIIVFKKDDLVRFIPQKFSFYKVSGKVGKVTEVVGIYIHVYFKHLNDWFPCREDEIEMAVQVGEQLEFAFMREVTK